LTIEEAFQACHDAIREKQDELIRQGKEEQRQYKMELATGYFDWSGKLEAAIDAVRSAAANHACVIRDRK